jgi:hypothetical protein
MEPTFKIMNAKADPRSRFDRRQRPRGGAAHRAVVIGGQRIHIHHPISLTATHMLEFRVELERYFDRRKIQILGPEGGFVTFEQAIEICEAHFAPEPERKIEVEVGVMDVEITPGADEEFATEDDVVKITPKPPEPKPADEPEAEVAPPDETPTEGVEDLGEGTGEEEGSPAHEDSSREEPDPGPTVEEYSADALAGSITALKDHLKDCVDAEYVEFLIEAEQADKDRAGAKSFLTELLDQLED